MECLQGRIFRMVSVLQSDTHWTGERCQGLVFRLRLRLRLRRRFDGGLRYPGQLGFDQQPIRVTKASPGQLWLGALGALTE